MSKYLTIRKKKFTNLLAMSIHIGSKIKEVFKSSGISVDDFAEMLSYTRQNIFGIFKRKSIDTELLEKIGNKLNHDFFQYYINSKTKIELNSNFSEKSSIEDYEVSITIKLNNPAKEEEILKIIGLK